ncbi:MAG: aminotransferase class III-fold pyridoxal phosphate-dependent enzyme, partial [Acidobacteria bacterium]|nr:aminotransferase class III-fold pyridoxal phosphate-dependent enzyme [Acidobacteriota bacterium]
RTNYFSTEEPAWELLERLLAVDPLTACHALLGGDDGAAPAAAGIDSLELRREREQRIGPSLSLAYDEPLQIVRGSGQYLYDHRGRPYLDLVNNVCHVGHCHPHVVAAAQRQMALLNTNTRYLHRGLTDYAERLTATLPPQLSVCFMVNSGSEANELALRLARAHTGQRALLVVEGAYHGHTSTLTDISPYKFLGPGGRGAAEPWVHMVPMPDGYRGVHKGHDRATGIAYGDDVASVLAAVGGPIAGLILESLLGCGGQIIPPPGYLETAYGHVRAAGGLCIADEVQVGFGRVGSHFWAFERQAVVPDIVVMGKPIGNGHPMAAVVTRPEIAASFANGMEFFCTFGGNPVSCAVGLAVLEVIENERLQHHALELGAHFLAGLRALGARHSAVGDVRGVGLFLGLELIRDRATLEPAADLAQTLVERMKSQGILLSTDGPLHNVLKIKPPMVLTRNDVDRVLRTLDAELEDLDAG